MPLTSKMSVLIRQIAVPLGKLARVGAIGIRNLPQDRARQLDLASHRL